MSFSRPFGFDFSGDPLFEIDLFRRKEGREIKPLTVREILDEEISSSGLGFQQAFMS